MMNRELPTGWEWKRLDEVCEKPEYGYTTSAKPDGEGPLFLRTTDISNGAIDWQSVPFCFELPKDEERYLLNDGDLLIARAGSVGESVVIKKPPRAIFASYLIRFRPKKELLNPWFAGFFLKSKLFWIQLGGKTAGTTLPGVNATNLSKVKIPCPPIETQRKIVTILEKAEATKKFRAQEDELTNQLLQSVFLEMFGDPVKNPKQWNLYKMNELCNLIRDGEHKTPTYVDIGIPFVTATNLIGEQINLTTTKRISKEENLIFSKRAKPEKNDLLMSKDGTIGVIQVVNTNEEFSIFVSVILIKPKKELVNSQFLKYLLSTHGIQIKIKERIKGIAIRHLHLIDLRDLTIPLPPLKQQNIFADIVCNFEKIKDLQNQSKKQIHDLFNDCMQKAFTGELVV